MFRYILVPANGADADTPVFRAALAIARMASGHLAFLHVRPDVEATVMAMAAGDGAGTAGMGDLMQRLDQVSAEGAARAEARVRDFCAAEQVALVDTPGEAGPSAAWRTATGDEAHIIAAHGRAADLTVLGRLRDDGGVALHLLQTVLLESGRPMLIVPQHVPERLGRKIAIAWKDGPEAARAVAAALPLLSGAETVTVVSVEEDARTTADACELLRHALLWHNPATTVRHVKPAGREPVDALFATLTGLGTDLLVTGGYSHSRFREVVFGGFTRRVLQAAELPVLMSH